MYLPPINLRQMFMDKIRNSVYRILIDGPLAGMDPRIVLQFVNESITARQTRINEYLTDNNVTLMNMNEHVEAVVKQILIPYLDEKRVQ